MRSLRCCRGFFAVTMRLRCGKTGDWRSQRNCGGMPLRPLPQLQYCGCNTCCGPQFTTTTTPEKKPRRSALLSLGTAPETKYDVFVIFRGREIRDNFLSHVLMALSRKKVVAYSDKKLDRGEEISVLHAAIERSIISLVIFSPDFASSKWCLDELVKIVECRRNFGRILLPVFYHIDPSHVRHQKGTYGDALAEHEKTCNLKKKVQTWRSALKESANISGIESSKFSDDAKLVEEIVKGVLTKLNQEQQVNSKGLVGIEKPISHIESLLHLELEDVRALGIWGMSGIGKTTIAEEVFNRLRSRYESYCYMAGVRQQSERDGEDGLMLRKRLLSTLLDDEDLSTDDIKNGLPPFAEKRLRRMKVLIFLDDVKDPRQLEVLVGTLDWLGPGSRIIITARDKQLLAKKVNDIYEVEALGFDESLRLFNWHAFGEQNHHLAMEYIELSKTMVNYANGFPLVLKALAHHLYGKDKRIWESQANNLKRDQIEGVHDVFRQIYNDLDYYEKQIFLDIACFFDGLNMGVDLIKVLLKDYDYLIDTKLDRLKDKALVTISQNNIVSMHDIIQEAGWEIVRQESIEEPGRRSRLLDPKDIYRVLKYDKGSETIRSIVIKPDTVKELQLSPQVFSKMSKLKFLDISFKESQNEGGLYPQGLESLPDELRFLRWVNYPFEYLPSDFSAENLVVLFLPFSRLKKLWHEVKDIVNLNVLILRSSTHLTELPNLSKATNLMKLDLSGCISLTRLESNIHFSSLTHLSLRNCTSLNDFSITSENMKMLDLEFSGIKQLPSSFGLQTKLEFLFLGNTHIKNLPDSIKKLTKLRHLYLQNCKELQTLPELPPSLETLDVKDCVSLKNVMFPSNAIKQQQQENKKRVTFWNCLKLDEDSLEAIGLNAKINMMNFAYKHLSTSYHEHDTRGMYVYPGNKVPKWFEYSTTTHDNITIDLSSAPYFPQLGFIFCFIIPAIPLEGLVLKFDISTTNDGEGEGEGCVGRYIDRRHGIKSDHVYLVYDTRCSRYLASQANDQPKIQIMVKVTSRTMGSTFVPMQLGGFGISLVYPSQFQQFIQQLELAQRSIPNNMCPV